MVMIVSSLGIEEFDRRLYAELVHCIAMDLFAPFEIVGGGKTTGIEKSRDSAKGKAGHWLWHNAMSTFERAFEILHAFPGFEPVDGVGRPVAPEGERANVKLVVDVDKITKCVLADFPAKVPELSDVLTAFIDLATYHGSISTSRKMFQIDPSYDALFVLLAQADYVGQIGDRFRWTEKIGPSMLATHHWNSNGRSLADTYENDLELIWQTMPEKFKQDIFFKPNIEISFFAFAYSTCWLGDHWDLTKLQAPSSDRIRISGGGVSVCGDLVDRFVRKHRPELP